MVELATVERPWSRDDLLQTPVAARRLGVGRVALEAWASERSILRVEDIGRRRPRILWGDIIDHYGRGDIPQDPVEPPKRDTLPRSSALKIRRKRR